jgi:hypothetical protein
MMRLTFDAPSDFWPRAYTPELQCLIHDLLGRPGSINKASFKRCLAQKKPGSSLSAIVIVVRNDYLSLTKENTLSAAQPYHGGRCLTS